MERPKFLKPEHRAKFLEIKKTLDRAKLEFNAICIEIRGDSDYQMAPEDSWDDHGRISYKSKPITEEK